MTNPDPDPLDAPLLSGKHFRALLGLLLVGAAPVLLYIMARDGALTWIEGASAGGMFLGGLFLCNQRSAWKDLGGWIVDLVKAIRGGGGA